MILIFLGLLLALVPLLYTTSLSHLMLVSIYAGLAHIAAFAWALFILTIIVRRQRIAEWRHAKLRKAQPLTRQ
ncbi:MAG: hypothetical protein ACAH12_03195 [Methylophilaceae bacterium]|uniref:hypothetical protein n=1 Tax=Methylovorus sp. MM2 TaxID=1848038 RepID=UPI0007E1FAF9|nr:hypothetical protein [Methylovorus sp. MM2]OAM51497.1 hypothetical protein A7981_08380 [Methylovorus sp. MM2]